ncbi:MAG: hypothetical protein Q8Q20_01085 [bacterium]|nr:hypothetical protein [bacterium]
MKKTIIILIIAVVGIVALYAAYSYGNKQGSKVDNVNNVSTQTEKSCSTICADQGVVCEETGDQPTCIESSLATGQKYSEPKCVCLNPNKDF